MTDNNTSITIDVSARVADVSKLRALMQALRGSPDFVEGVDYATIPGTEKPSLLQPGAEKIMRALEVYAEYGDLPETKIDYDKPLFHYAYECRLVHIPTKLVVGSAKGSCNSYETKYRYRNAARVCPSCNGAFIIKGKAEFGGGWLCYQKKGGCGAKYGDNDPQIEDQRVGMVENDMIFDQVNTIQKMAQKRALVSAVKSLAAVSEFFTVDIDDSSPAQSRSNGNASANDAAAFDDHADLGNDKARKAFFEFCKEEFDLKPADVMKALNVQTLKGVKRGEALDVLGELRKEANQGKGDSDESVPEEVF